MTTEARPHSITFTQPSKTVQSFQKSCDINNIMRRYQKTGVIEHINRNEPRYGIATGQTFKEAMDLLASAQAMFDELPSEARKHFNHDPAAFFDYINGVDGVKPDAQLLHDLGLTDNPPPQAEKARTEPPAASEAASGSEERTEQQ